MNKLLLAGVAALSVLASAQAAPRLPNSLFNKLGCFNRDDDRIFRATDPEDQYPYANPYEPGCANRGGVRFFRVVTNRAGNMLALMLALIAKSEKSGSFVETYIISSVIANAMS